MDCLQQKIAFRLGNELGELFHQRSVVLQKVIIFLKNLLVKPESMQACPSIDKMVWYLAIGLTQRGYAIELLEITSPATPFLIDVQGRQTGIQEDGSVVEEIPDSSVAVTSVPSNIIV